MTAAGDGTPVIQVRDVVKEFRNGSEPLLALKGVSVSIHANEYVAIVGASGSGKSTLLSIIGCLDKADGGDVTFEGRHVSSMTPSDICRLRNRRIGFVFQNYSLLPKLTALENVAQPLVFAGVRRAERQRIAGGMLERIGLADRMGHYPNQLSGGQQQRVAAARALVNEPAVILADEPTGNLDVSSRETLLQLFDSMHSQGNTIVMVTHDRDIASRCGRTIEIRDGMVIE